VHTPDTLDVFFAGNAIVDTRHGDSAHTGVYTEIAARGRITDCDSRGHLQYKSVVECHWMHRHMVLTAVTVIMTVKYHLYNHDPYTYRLLMQSCK